MSVINAHTGPGTASSAVVSRAHTSVGDEIAAEEHYSMAMGYLRAFLTLLVIAHHAVLAYVDFAPAPAPASLVAVPRLWQALPVIDTQRWAGFSLLVGVNDTFFMSLMFFLAGLFTWSSLTRKGAGRFMRDRTWRLGVPFLVSAAILAPLAYYAAYVVRTPAPSLAGFRDQWLALGNWPAGPAWFLWVLLAFSGIAAAVVTATRGRGVLPTQVLSRIGARPLVAFGILVAASTLAYVPLMMAFSPFHWAAFGPFTVQTSRVLYYTLYFGAGVAMGASPLASGFLAPAGALTRRWLVWTAAALVASLAGFAIVIAAMAQGPGGSYLWGLLAGFSFAFSCAATSFALLALFLRFTRRSAVLDSLRRNAYGMYLVHYAAVAWLQYSLLGVSTSGFAKGVLVFAGATAVSWAATAALRRFQVVARVI